MSETKPVELTEAERDEITRLFGYVPDNEPLEFMLAAVTRIKAAARREALDEVFRRINADRSAEIERLGGIDKVRASVPLNNWVDGIGVGARHASDVHDNRRARSDHRPHEVWASDARDVKAAEETP